VKENRSKPGSLAISTSTLPLASRRPQPSAISRRQAPVPGSPGDRSFRGFLLYTSRTCQGDSRSGCLKAEVSSGRHRLAERHSANLRSPFSVLRSPFSFPVLGSRFSVLGFRFCGLSFRALTPDGRGPNCKAQVTGSERYRSLRGKPLHFQPLRRHRGTGEPPGPRPESRPLRPESRLLRPESRLLRPESCPLRSVSEPLIP